MIATSPDGQWAAVRRGREVVLLAGGAGPATSRVELASDDADMVIVGPPSVLAVATRGDGADQLVLYQPPYLDAVARLELEQPMRIAAITGPRLVLVSMDGKAVTIVRVAGRALSAQSIDPGSPVEFAVGLERNQVLFALLRKLEAWDAVSGRPLLRMQLALPPPPRVVGPAHGHIWSFRRDGDEVVVCRLSDGRPFRHRIGAAIHDAIAHPSSPLVILVTERGLVRLHCFAHSLTVIDAPWQPGVPLGQLVNGEDISLLGMAEHDDEPWRVPIGGTGAPAFTLESVDVPSEPGPTAADKLRAMRDRTSAGTAQPEQAAPPAWPTSPPPQAAPPAWPASSASSSPSSPTTWPTSPASPPSPPSLDLPRERDREHAAAAPTYAPPRNRAWRDPLAGFGAELARGAEAELPVVAADTELGQLAHRLALPATARRGLIALYSLHLVGEAGVSIARLAHVLGEWSEALGQGELGALALLRRRGGKLALRSSVTDVLDGVGPRAIRLVGGAAARPQPGATRLARDGKVDADLESELATQLGRIAVIEGGPALALLEARLHGTTAVALDPPLARPQPWPRDAGLIVVADQRAPAWVAALPSFTAA